MLTRLTSREWFRGLSNEAKDALTFGFLLTPRLGLAMASNILTQSDTSGRGAVSIQASVSVATSLAGTERESTSISESTSFRGHSGRKEWLPRPSSHTPALHPRPLTTSLRISWETIPSVTLHSIHRPTCWTKNLLSYTFHSYKLQYSRNLTAELSRSSLTFLLLQLSRKLSPDTTRPGPLPCREGVIPSVRSVPWKKWIQK